MSLSPEDMSRLNTVFNPRSIAVIGATDSPDRVGYQLLEALILNGYPGRIYPIHPRHHELQGVKVYQSIEDTPQPVDLVMIALNEKKSIDALHVCGEHGVKGAVCVAGGYKEVGEEGRKLELELAETARRYGIMLVGPNTLGFFNTESKLNATFYPEILPPANGISVVTQSGGIGRIIIEELRDEGLGISKWIGVGNRAVLDFSDFVDYLAQDQDTRVITLFIEGTEKGRELMEAAARAAHQKPVIVYRAGNSDVAKRAAVTHTGSMISSPRLFSDACRQFGVLEAGSLSELVSMAKALTMLPSLPEGGIGIMTHTAGPSISLLDGFVNQDAQLAEFTPQTMRRLEEMFAGVPVILKNPLDAAAFGYSQDGYGRVAEMVISDPNVSILVAIYTLHKNWKFAVPQLIALKQRYQKPVVACFISTQNGANENREALQAAGIPCFTSIERAAWGIAAAVKAKRMNHAR